MRPLRVLILRPAIVLGAALTCGALPAADPWPEPRPIASDLPAFRAPAEPPPADAPQNPLPAEPAGPLALRDALALALLHNPSLADVSWEVRASEARALQAGKLPNPELDVRVYRLESEDPSTDPDDGRARVILSERFELGGKRQRRVVLRDREIELAGWDYEAKRIEVATIVAGHFAAVLGAQRKVESWGQLVEFLDKLRGHVASLVETGALRSLEIHEVTRGLGLARIELEVTESELSASRFRLAATWGARAPRFAEAAGTLEPPSPLPDIDTVLELARQSPAIARRDAEVARGEAALALARAGRVPDLRAGVGVRWQQNTDAQGYLVDVAIALPLFDRKQGETLEARHMVARARAERESAEAVYGAEIADSYYRLAASATRASRLEREVVPAVRAIFESQQRGLELGPRSLEDLLDARRDLARAEVEHWQALVDYHQARAVLEGLVGRARGGEE